MGAVLKEKKVAVIISPSWPNITGGYGLAVRSSLLVYERFFDKIYFICLANSQYAPLEEFARSSIEWVHVAVKDSALWWRFLQSLVLGKPAISIRYYLQHDEVMCLVRSTLERCPKSSAVIFEDIPAAVFLSEIADAFPGVRTAIRSHNLTVKAFEPLCRVGSAVRRFAWRYEVGRIADFEKAACKRANSVWAISGDDAAGYGKVLAIKVDGVMGVCLDVWRYIDVPFGDSRTVVCVGTADLRKGSSLTAFVSEVWPVVRGELPDAQLVLAGKGTEVYTDFNAGIQGRGFVQDDRDILGLGQIFINPQVIGSGIQLKSIVAMLAGKVLISTRLGVEGIDGSVGSDFLVAEDNCEMAATIVRLMMDSEMACRVGKHARALGVRKYEGEAYVAESLPLLACLMGESVGISG